MPFLPLPADPSLLRFHDGQVTLHYLISTPTHPTFALARTHASSLASSLVSPHSPITPPNHRSPPPKSEVSLDPRYPLILFLPSECFSVTHLFSTQLADPVISSRFNLVALDPRGHGLTREAPVPTNTGKKYDLDVKAADCLDFLHLLLGGRSWEKGMHVVACSMSGLVAARMAAEWEVESITITSPIVERESQFMIESFQGIKELLEETWHAVHRPTSPTPSDAVKMPGEVVHGFTYRWAGNSGIPQHIASYLSQTWLHRLVLHPQGLSAARDWWFDLYWLRRPMSTTTLDKVKCRVLVVEGETDLPYERGVAEDVLGLFTAASERKTVKVKGAPFLVSVMRGEELARVICQFLNVDGKDEDGKGNLGEEERGEVGDGWLGLDAEERFELVQVYAPGMVADPDDSDDDSDHGEHEEAPLSPVRLRLHHLSSGPTFTTTPTRPRNQRKGSNSSASDHYPLSFTGTAKQGGQGVLVKTLQETHL